jgi:hypothetical protein
VKLGPRPTVPRLTHIDRTQPLESL